MTAWPSLVLPLLLLVAASGRGEATEPRTDVTSPEAVRPILVGTPVPDGAVKAQDGQDTTLGELRAGQPSVLVFYRGHW